MTYESERTFSTICAKTGQRIEPPRGAVSVILAREMGRGMPPVPGATIWAALDVPCPLHIGADQEERERVSIPVETAHSLIAEGMGSTVIGAVAAAEQA